MITPLTKWGSVWGTSVTVPVTISTSYVPQTKWGNILVLLGFLLCSPNEVGEHIGFTLFLIIIIKSPKTEFGRLIVFIRFLIFILIILILILIIIIILPYLKICPHDYKKTLQPIHTKLSEGV